MFLYNRSNNTKNEVKMFIPRQDKDVALAAADATPHSPRTSFDGLSG